MRRRYVFLAAMAVLIPLLLWAGADILSFTAEAQSEAVLLIWRTGVEMNISTFQIQRSSNGTSFYTIGQASPTGSYSEYRYLDNNILQDGLKTYYYRLRIVDLDGTVTFSEVREVTLSYSGILQTWGSIKAMFR